MLLEKMYVRCPIDHDKINPRDFLMGQISKIDSFSDSVEVVFRDPFNYRKYYDGFPKSAHLPTSLVQHCQFFYGSIVLYEEEKYKIIACKKHEDTYYEYYLENIFDKQYGEKMLQGAEKAVSDFGGKRVELSTQCRVAEFYKKQGYMELNDIHMDEDCPHAWMRKEV